MSHKVKNSSVVYSLFCPACSKPLNIQNFGHISGKTNRHLTTDACPSCKAVLSIDYDKEQNKVVATAKELKGVELPIYNERMIYAVKHIENPYGDFCGDPMWDTHWSICVYRNNAFHHTGDCNEPILQYVDDEILGAYPVAIDEEWIAKRETPNEH